PDEPPYLRGPAQGPAPPSCVPPDLARDAVDGYEAFVDAYDRAIGFGGVGPVDPDLPAIDATMVEPQLSSLRAFVADLRASGEAFRGERDEHDPWAISANEGDNRVVVYDCVEIGKHGRVDEAASEPADVSAHADTMRLDGAAVHRDRDEWKVAGVSVIEEGLEQCSSSAP
ncbi:MAG TPA: hypothetical protein VFZ70_07250, partial [Euzebyales bacterium]